MRESKTAKAILICGKICCGKSTYAEQLRKEIGAVVLSADEIMLELFGLYAGDRHDEYAEKIQKYLFDKSAQIIDSGSNVVLDWGFWTREDRAQARAFYTSRNMQCELHYMDIDDTTWKERIDRRNKMVQVGETQAYTIDSELMRKFDRCFEPPAGDEIDVQVNC